MREFKPTISYLKQIERGNYLYTYLGIQVSPVLIWGFVSRVDLKRIEQQMYDGTSDGVSGFFGSLFKGIKKAVKTVGKVTGLNKVVKLAGKVLNNPVVKAIVPGASLAAGGVKVARDIMTATVAAKAKHPIAKRALAMAYARSKKLGFDKPEIQKTAAKMYQLIIKPN